MPEERTAVREPREAPPDGLGKDLLDLESLPAEAILRILETAAAMKAILARPIRKVPTLRGRTVLTLFYEASTRTKNSFEAAAKALSADTMSVATATSSMSKGETLLDTVRTCQAMGAEAVVIRHPVAGVPAFLAKRLEAHVINAGDGMHEHPTQGLLDLFTIRERKGRVAGLKVAIVGDIRHGRVARSNLWGLSKLGAEVRLAGPPTLLPPGIEGMVPGVRVTTRVEEAVEGADVVYALRVQRERMEGAFFPSLREYATFWGITPERLRLARPDALLMHPGPVNRGVELASELVDGPQSAIEEQVRNGVAVRMAVLYHLLGGGEHA